MDVSQEELFVLTWVARTLFLGGKRKLPTRFTA
jgi:hypothetical protein